jgi:hypothetical protein
MNLCYKICVEYIKEDFVGLLFILIFFCWIVIWFFHKKSMILTNIFKRFFDILNSLYLKKMYISLWGLFIGFLVGIIGNLMALNHKNSIFDLSIDSLKHLNEAIGNTISYIALNTPTVSNTNPWIWSSYIIISFIVSISAVILFLRVLFEKNLAKALMKNENIIIFGYGDIGKSFLKTYFSEYKNKNVLVIDKNEALLSDDHFKNAVFLQGDINNETFFNMLNFENSTDIIITLGEDRLNLDLAIKIIEKLKLKQKSTKIILHLNNTSLGSIFFDNEFIGNKNNKIDLKIFSYPTEVIDDLFEKYYLKLFPDLNNEYQNIAIIGDSDISIELLKQIIIRFVFNKDVLIRVFLVGTKEFYEKTKFIINFDKNKFPNIDLIYKKYSLEFLKNKEFWNSMDNILIVSDDENTNLDLTFKLQKYTFGNLSEIKANIFFNIYHEYVLSEKININNSHFKKFFAFGLGRNVFGAKKILDDCELLIAQLIHCGYEGGNFNINECLKKWYSIDNIYKKMQNIAQFRHIDAKLYIFGLKRIKSNKEFKTLKKINNDIFWNNFKIYLDNNEIYEAIISNVYNKNKITELLKKWIYIDKNKKLINLLNMEHRRWMNYYFLEGWEYSKKRDDNFKKHNCLIEINKFDNEELKNKIIYDFQSFIYIPLYLAKGGYEIVNINQSSIS